MLLRDYLNEFELDWAQAPVRSGLIPEKKVQGARVLVIGADQSLCKAIEYSFLAWNEKKEGTVSAERAQWDGEKLNYEGEQPAFSVKEAEYVILTGYCSCDIQMNVGDTMLYLKKFRALLQYLIRKTCKRVLLLSDGRVYGRLGTAFAASEYEMGTADPTAQGEEAAYLLQTMESMFVSAMKPTGIAFTILRTGLLYGPGITMMRHPAAVLARKMAAAEPVSVTLTQERSSYICINDLLTAVQFVLTRCPANKIFNVSGLDSDASEGEIAMLLYKNFPQQADVSMKSRSEEQTEDGSKEPFCAKLAQHGLLLNTQLLCHYGFRPTIRLEDGLIILVKSLQNTGEVFIFDNTYLGKLEQVHKILLGYLLEIDRICRKHNIKYFLAGGTLLGAIRHHGFIPWDDDADVMMLREDYDRFQEVVRQELPDNIFVQLPQTEKGNYNPFTKLRINNTMFATEFTGHFMNMHNGIFFDVLAHDRTGKRRWSQKLHLMVTMLTRSIVFNKWGNTNIKSGGAHPLICKFVDRAKYLVPMKLALWAQEKSLLFFKGKNTGYLYDGMGRNLKRGAFPASWLDEVTYVDFEGYQFPVPKEYDNYLTYLYGDYMQMIPVSQRRTSHSIVLTDLGEYTAYDLPKRQKDSGVIRKAE